MENKVKRPISVWIAQIILVISALMFLLSFVLAGMILFSRSNISVIGMLITFAINLALITLFLTAVWGMSQRGQYGRWLGIGMLSLIFVLATLSQIFKTSGPIQLFEYDNSTQLMAAVVAQVAMGLLFLFLILYLAFAESVSSFFSLGRKSLVNDPPPPPTFDH